MGGNNDFVCVLLTIPIFVGYYALFVLVCHGVKTGLYAYFKSHRKEWNSIADREEKIAAVTRLYNEIGIDKRAQAKIAYYFEQSKKYLDAVQVPAERKEELQKYAQRMMKRKY